MPSLTQTTGSVTSVHSLNAYNVHGSRGFDAPAQAPIGAFHCLLMSADWLTWTSAAPSYVKWFSPVPYKGNAYSSPGQLSSRSGRTHTVMEQNHKQDGQSDVFAGFKTAFKSFATEAIHVGQEPEQWKSMAVVPPISLSTTFKQHAPGNHSVSSLPACLGYLKQGVRG